MAESKLFVIMLVFAEVWVKVSYDWLTAMLIYVYAHVHTYAYAYALVKTSLCIRSRMTFTFTTCPRPVFGVKKFKFYKIKSKVESTCGSFIWEFIYRL